MHLVHRSSFIMHHIIHIDCNWFSVLCLGTILGELRTQLQERSKKVKPVLGAIFLLNNFHFIAQAARAELRPLLGDADLADLESLQSSARSVYRNSWNETLEFLWEPKGWQNNKSGKTVIKKRFKVRHACAVTNDVTAVGFQ